MDVSLEAQKDLIRIDTDLPTFRNNPMATAALQEFVTSPLLNRICLVTRPLIVKGLVELVRKTAKFPLTHTDLFKERGDIEDHLRKAIVLCIKSSRDVYEGEVVDIKRVMDEHGRLQCIEMSLRSLKSTKSITLGRDLIELVNDVNVGDVVYIEPNVGILRRLGRSETRINEYDLEGDVHVPLLKAGVHSTREKDIYVSLYEFDYAFNKYSVDISDFTRRQVDAAVAEYVLRGVAHFVRGGLYLENCGLLDEAGIYRLVNASEKYPHLKILIDNAGGAYLRNAFMFVDCMEDENAFDVFQYFIKDLPEELKETVARVVTHENYQAVQTALGISRNSKEFMEIFQE